jgi:predicted nucleotidyltransferase
MDDGFVFVHRRYRKRNTTLKGDEIIKTKMSIVEIENKIKPFCEKYSVISVVLFGSTVTKKPVSNDIDLMFFWKESYCIKEDDIDKLKKELIGLLDGWPIDFIIMYKKSNSKIKGYERDLRDECFFQNVISEGKIVFSDHKSFSIGSTVEDMILSSIKVGKF